MERKKPTICQLLYTYNRAEIVPKAIESVLNQTYRDFELVLINNGSTDNTREVLEKYKDHEKVRVIHLEKNLGSNGGMNFALDQIAGEWFGVLGDDDYLYEFAFEEAMKVVDQFDPSINAITANATATATGKFAGIGLETDQYLTVETIIKNTTGDFFGLIKTELLGDHRLNENLPGDCNSLWFKIDAVARRYYIHKALMVYNNQAGDTLTTVLEDISTPIRIQRYKELLKEQEYLGLIQRYNPKQFRARCLRGMYFMKVANQQQELKKYHSYLENTSPTMRDKILSELIKLMPGAVLGKGYEMAGRNKSTLSIFRKLFKKHTLIRE